MVLFSIAAAMAVALLALTLTAQQRSSSNRFVLMQKLYDVDGPSARDPARAAWDTAGKVRIHTPYTPNVNVYIPKIEGLYVCVSVCDVQMFARVWLCLWFDRKRMI